MALPQELEEGLQKHLEELAQLCVENLQRSCPVRSGKMRNSFEAQGSEVLGVEYALTVDKKHPFIEAAASGV